ncbi:MAG: pirin family protein [Phycisphaeraceae bacterium]
MTATTPNIEIRRASDRGRTQIGWLDSAHSFSFGRYHDPRRMGYRSLRVINDDVIQPGTGFGEHGHDNMEIVTWVLEGALRHGDSLANSRELTPGEVQVMSAGSGIRHSEFNASDTEPGHFIQVWIEPKGAGIAPRYDQATIDAEARRNAFAPIASGRDKDVERGAPPIHQDAAVLVADLDPGGKASYSLAEGRGAYIHLATGKATVAGHRLEAGDAAIVETPGEIVVEGIDASQAMLFDLA